MTKLEENMGTSTRVETPRQAKIRRAAELESFQKFYKYVTAANKNGTTLLSYHTLFKCKFYKFTGGSWEKTIKIHCKDQFTHLSPEVIKCIETYLKNLAPFSMEQKLPRSKSYTEIYPDDSKKTPEESVLESALVKMLERHMREIKLPNPTPGDIYPQGHGPSKKMTNSKTTAENKYDRSSARFWLLFKRAFTQALQNFRETLTTVKTTLNTAWQVINTINQSFWQSPQIEQPPQDDKGFQWQPGQQPGLIN